MHEQDYNHYQLIKQFIIDFENGKLKLSELINGVYGLLNFLQSTEEDWVDRFRSEWWTLEQVYAVALDRGETTLNSDSESLVYETLENMKTLLKEIG